MNLLKTAIKMGAINKRKIKAIFRKRPRVMKYPKDIENKYATLIKGVVQKWIEVYKLYIQPRLNFWATQYYMNRPSVDNLSHLDGVIDDINALMKTLNIDMTKTIQPITNQVGAISSQIALRNSAEWSKVVQSVIGIPPIFDEPWLNNQLNTFNAQNVKLISNISTNISNDIESIIQNGFQKGMDIGSINEQIIGTGLQKGKLPTIESRAELIARDQISKLNGQLSELRQTTSGVKYYIWRTSMDERVRDSHAAMEGKLCRWDDATVYSIDNGKTWIERTTKMVKLHPGQDYQCRCWAEAYFIGMLGEVDLGAIFAGL